ncbi:BQ5605_C015g07953 [Microbotryum silenes-dioicae]|uniref:BQ5605_C015g07953 protein n=1 Tax=Microbotryum silenes-dioicae TaxID=796604 RepID=A0A2X0LTP3_9BASI|nr:BQ5605_C015g07953 [Microbotryum silenes-dioicae]
MFFARSGVVAASLLVLRSTLSMAAPLSEKPIHELEKRISCHTTEVPINNACVSCASLHKNATTCTYGVVNPGPEYQINYGVVNSGRKYVCRVYLDLICIVTRLLGWFLEIIMLS